MANTTISPNMNLPVPTVAVDPGPDWATNVDACLNAIDSHNHSAGQGVPITPSGMSINSDLAFGSNNAYLLRSVRFVSQSATIAASADIGCIYEVAGDLWWNNASGTAVQLTVGNSPAGGGGSISGLPSGSAGVSFAAATYSFTSATNTPATISVGPIITGAATASPKTVTISASGSQPADYAMTWPLSLPGSTSFINIDASGNMATVATTGTGQVVLATSPTITSPTFAGTSSGTIVSGTYTPAFTVLTGSTVAARGVFRYMRINNTVTVFGTISGKTGAAGVLSITFPVPINPTSNFSSGDVSGVSSPASAAAFTFLSESAGSKSVSSISIFSGGSGISEDISVSFIYSCA